MKKLAIVAAVVTVVIGTSVGVAHANRREHNIPSQPAPQVPSQPEPTPPVPVVETPAPQPAPVVEQPVIEDTTDYIQMK